MAQEVIVNLLKKNKKPLSRSEIALQLNLDPIMVSHNIRKLLKYYEVKCIEINRFQAMKEYGCRRRIRLYYI